MFHLKSHTTSFGGAVKPASCVWMCTREKFNLCMVFYFLQVERVLSAVVTKICRATCLHWHRMRLRGSQRVSLLLKYVKWLQEINVLSDFVPRLQSFHSFAATQTSNHLNHDLAPSPCRGSGKARPWLLPEAGFRLQCDISCSFSIRCDQSQIQSQTVLQKGQLSQADL